VLARPGWLGTCGPMSWRASIDPPAETARVNIRGSTARSFVVIGTWASAPNGSRRMQKLNAIASQNFHLAEAAPKLSMDSLWAIMMTRLPQPLAQMTLTSRVLSLSTALT
jgi:hypothetical protein